MIIACCRQARKVPPTGQEERFWGVRAAGGRQGMSLLASVTSRHKFSSHAQDLLQYLQLCPWHCRAARLQLLRERSFSHHLISSAQRRAGIWAIYLRHSLSHPGAGCIPAPCASAADVPDPPPGISTLSAFCTQLLPGYPPKTFQNAFAIFPSNMLDVARGAAPSRNDFLQTFAWMKSGIGRNPCRSNQRKPVWQRTKVSLSCEVVAAWLCSKWYPPLDYLAMSCSSRGIGVEPASRASTGPGMVQPKHRT